MTLGAYPSIDELFGAMDITPGMTVYVASDIARLWEEYREHHDDFSTTTIIGCLQRLVTEDGTLLFPTYSWDFCHGKGFDIRRTRTRTGALSAAALKTPGFRRTRHPIYSCAVWGKKKDFYAELDNKSAWGEGSPFYRMHRDKAVIITLGVPFRWSFTFTHYIEESVGVPYRYMKDFTGPYTDERGETNERTYSMYVRDLDMDPRITSAADLWFGRELVDRAITRYGADLSRIPCERAYDVIKHDIETNHSKNFVTCKGQM